jgi:hypothetical protein
MLNVPVKIEIPENVIYVLVHSGQHGNPGHNARLLAAMDNSLEGVAVIELIMIATFQRFVLGT